MSEASPDTYGARFLRELKEDEAMKPGGPRPFGAKYRVLIGGVSIALACVAAAAAVFTVALAVDRLRAYLQHETRGPLSEMPPWVLVGILWLTVVLVWAPGLAGKDADPSARDAGRVIGVVTPVAFLAVSLSLLGFLLTVFATEPIQVKAMTGLSYALATLGAALVATGLAILGRVLLRRPKEGTAA